MFTMESIQCREAGNKKADFSPLLVNKSAGVPAQGPILNFCMEDLEKIISFYDEYEFIFILYFKKKCLYPL